ncbi:MAG TPA: penicillin-binding transpeptidase domain-containing protein [Candidatus Eisenbacteria bacterium]|nr:penicillin-binding transpeptidase domain-containing protein [Candidatus Eisenbacteria bacterium]
MNPRDRGRLRAIAILGLCAFAVLLARLVTIQVVGHARYAREARSQQTRRVILEPERGRIFDRHLRPLAENVALSQISVRPGEVQNATAVRDFISKTAGANGVRRFRQGRSQHRAYVRVAAQLKPEKEIDLKSTRLPEGIHIDPVPGRVYPLDELARPVLGVVGNEGHGLEGLEQVFDRDLQGSPGWATLFTNGRGTNYELPRSMVKLPESGGSLVTTIDLDAQSVAVMKLREAVARTGAKSGMAVFVDPKTGDILAMATVDGPGAAGDEHRNRVVADQYEPGSTFKILAGCAAIEEKLFSDQESVWVYQGKVDMGGFTIHDSHPDTGWYTLRRATSHSSNCVYAQVGTRVGPERLYRYARLFGFGQPTRVQLPGEAPGVIREPARWSKRSLATISIGHEVLVTPLQVVMAYAAVANGGMLMRPRVASAIVDEEGEPIREIQVEPVRRVISEATAKKFREFLRDAVTEGTASEAALPWCEVAGKTGTAQKTVQGTKGYGVGRYIASFVGMVPADDPKVVGLVVLDEPRGAYYGGEVAAPVFREIVASWSVQGRGPLAMPTTELVSGGDPPAPSASRVPDVRLLAPGRAREVLGREGFDVRLSGEGARVLAQDPAPGEPAPRGATVSLTLASATETDEVVMPDLRGLSIREAITQLRALDIPVERVRGSSGRVVNQSPEPGRAVRRETRAVLTLDPRGA